MKYIDLVVLAVAAVIVGLAMWYIHRAKKKGIRCIGCPDSKTCSGNCGHCSCCCGEQRAEP